MVDIVDTYFVALAYQPPCPKNHALLPQRIHRLPVDPPCWHDVERSQSRMRKPVRAGDWRVEVFEGSGLRTGARENDRSHVKVGARGRSEDVLKALTSECMSPIQPRHRYPRSDRPFPDKVRDSIDRQPTGNIPSHPAVVQPSRRHFLVRRDLLPLGHGNRGRRVSGWR